MKRHLALAAVAATLIGAPAARADLLVTREGVAIETAGPWRVEGRMVVFTLPGGALSSIRADQVDLDRSAVATARAATVEVAAADAPSQPAPLPEPVFRINDRARAVRSRSSRGTASTCPAATGSRSSAPSATTAARW
jgi:hypothetical protein